MTSVATPAVTTPTATATAAPADAARISLKDIARAHDVRFLLATFVDMTGKPCAKLVPVEAADDLEAEVGEEGDGRVDVADGDADVLESDRHALHASPAAPSRPRRTGPHGREAVVTLFVSAPTLQRCREE